MTPVETVQVIEAYAWRDRLEQRKGLALAWRTAAFSRSKKLPSLQAVLNTGPAKPLRGPELLKRREEFADMRKALDVSGLLAKLKVPAPPRSTE